MRYMPPCIIVSISDVRSVSVTVDGKDSVSISMRVRLSVGVSTGVVVSDALKSLR